jgi:hypothetical protein
MCKETAGGLDGWTIKELVVLPLEIWRMRATVMNLAEEIHTFQK